MAPKRNNMIPNGHFHKDWQHSVKTWFNQPARKLKRRQQRLKKSQALAPKPTGLLQPIVRCPSVRYHSKVRAGRGFSLSELKAAKLNPLFSQKIGISVDHRRRNKSIESIQLNAQRLKEYQAKVIVFPLNKKRVTDMIMPQVKGKILPIKQTWGKYKARVPSEEEKKFNACAALSKARADARFIGIRAKRMKDAAEKLDTAKNN